jgi:DNA-binding PadR family transcriptional regulator
MTKNEFSDSELLILGLIAEMPRHGYELEGIIEERAMREWTRIGFSSIYYVLGKLEKNGLITAAQPVSAKARKRYDLTDKGREVLIDQTIATLKTVEPTYPSLLLGLIHLAALSREQTLDAIKTRKDGVAREIKRIEQIHFQQQPLPDYVDAVFEFSLGQLKTEADWIDRTLEYMETKAWLT